MGLFLFLLLLGFIIVLLGHFVTPTPIKVSMLLPFWGEVKDIPVIMLLFASSIFGGIVVYLGLFLKNIIGKVEGLSLVWKKKEQERIQDLLEKGVECITLEKIDDGIKYLEKYLEFNPTDIKAVNILGDVYYRQDRVEKALALHARAGRLKPNQLVFKYKVLKDYVRQENDKNVETIVRELIERDPENIENSLRLQNILLKEDRILEAYELQKEIVKKVSDNKREREKQQKILLGILYDIGMEKTRTGNEQEALKVFKEILKTDKVFLPALISMGDIQMNLEDYAGASNTWRKGYKLIPETSLLLRLEKLYLSEENPDEILRIYKESLEDAPDNIQVYVSLCLLYLKLEMLDETEEVLKNIPIDKTTSPIIHYLIGNLFDKRHNWSEAAKYYKRACKGITSYSYTCKNCGQVSPNWVGKCSHCKSWDTLSFSL